MPGKSPFAGEPDPLPPPHSAGGATGAGRGSSWGAKAAQLSWQLPIAGVLANLVLGALIRDQKAAIGALLLAVCVVGAAAALVALVSIARFGWRRILFPACIGLLLNGVLLYVFVAAMEYVRQEMERG